MAARYFEIFVTDTLFTLVDWVTPGDTDIDDVALWMLATKFLGNWCCSSVLWGSCGYLILAIVNVLTAEFVSGGEWDLVWKASLG